MKRVLVAALVAVLSPVALAAAASADTNQPSQGETSTGRNDAGFGGGPHCHVLAVDNGQDVFDFIRVFPSHTGHAASGLPNRIFIADPDCDGVV